MGTEGQPESRNLCALYRPHACARPPSSHPHPLIRVPTSQALLVLLQNPMNGDAASAGGPHMVALLAQVAVRVRPKPLRLLTGWLAQLPPDVLGGRVVQPLQRHLTTYIEARGSELGRHEEEPARCALTSRLHSHHVPPTPRLPSSLPPASGF